MFGLKIMKKKKFESQIKDAKREGLWNIVELLKKKDKIYLGTVRMKGNGQTIKDCVFFGKEQSSIIYIKK